MALKLTPYVFVRPSNLCFAQWNEIDFVVPGVWRFPAYKMRTKREHPTLPAIQRLLSSKKCINTAIMQPIFSLASEVKRRR